MVREVEDDCPDASWLGEYGDTWKPGCVDRRRGNYGIRPLGWRYFYPCNTLEDTRRSLSKMGYSKHAAYTMARSYVLQDFCRLESLGQDWWLVGLIATAYLNGIELGGASLWGIESDGDEYLDSVADDLTHEAVAEAIAARDSLCCSGAQ